MQAQLVRKKDFLANINQFYAEYVELARADEFIHPRLQKIVKNTAGGKAQYLAWIGGVRSLKTSSMMMLCGWHLTGVYPNGNNQNKFNPEYVYDGYRYNRPTKIMVVAQDFSIMRSTLQDYLLNGMGFKRAPDILYYSLARKGSTGAYDEMRIPHWTDGKYDGDSTVIFKSNKEGERAFQSFCNIDCIFIDEEPTMPVFNECCCRLPAMYDPDEEEPFYTFLFLSMCPNHSMTDVVSVFAADTPPDVVKNGAFYTHSGWAENPFMSDRDKAILEASTPPHLVAARKYGYPTFGVGKVFTFGAKEVMLKTEDRPDIPPFFRLVIGLDPAATTDGWWGGVLLALDPDNNDVYVVREYLKSGLTYAEHADNIRTTLMDGFSEDIPIICDPAGGGEDQQTRLTALEYLVAKFGFNITKAYKACGAKEAACSQVYNLWRESKLHVFPTCRELLRQFDKYSRDEKNRIIKVDDHLIDAMFYALNKIDCAISMNELLGGRNGGSYEKQERRIGGLKW